MQIIFHSIVCLFQPNNEKNVDDNTFRMIFKKITPIVLNIYQEDKYAPNKSQYYGFLKLNQCFQHNICLREGWDSYVPE